MTQYVDVVPTLVEAAGGATPENLDGRSFLNVLTGKTDEHREYVFGVQTTRGIINGSESYPIRSIRDRRFKYIWNLNSDERFRNIITGKKGQPDSLLTSWVKAGGKAAERAQFYEVRTEEEFYDLSSDPFELTNLASDPKNRQRMDEMRKRLEGWMAQQGDKGIATELRARERQGRRNAKPKPNTRKPAAG